MRIAIFDENLMWSVKLSSGISQLGHSSIVIDSLASEIPAVDVAIVNLGSARLPAGTLIPQLKDKAIKVIAHAGHKEKPLLTLGNECGADLVVTNGELTHKLGEILAKLMK